MVRMRRSHMWTRPAHQCVVLRASHRGRNAASKHADPPSRWRFFGCFAGEQRLLPLSLCCLELVMLSLSGSAAGLTSWWD